jgi:hypothetical protein
VEPAALLACSRVDVAQCGPRAPRRSRRRRAWARFAALEGAEHAGPALGRLAVAVLDREQLLGAVLADADHDQQAKLRVLAEADLDVDPVHEQVRVAAEAEQPPAEPLVVLLPLLAQPADRRRREPGGILAEQPFQRWTEVAGRQAAQIQDRDHLADLRRPPGVRRQDLRAELLSLALLIDASVVDPGGADRDRPRPDRHLPLSRAAVADDPPVPVLVALVAQPLDVLVGLGSRSAAAIIRLAPSRAS